MSFGNLVYQITSWLTLFFTGLNRIQITKSSKQKKWDLLFSGAYTVSQILQFSLFICHVFMLRFWSKQKIEHTELDRPALLTFTTWWLKAQQMTTYGKKWERKTLWFSWHVFPLFVTSVVWEVIARADFHGLWGEDQHVPGLLQAGDVLAAVDMTEWLTSRSNKSSYLTKKGLLREILGELMHLKHSQSLCKEEELENSSEHSCARVL